MHLITPGGNFKIFVHIKKFLKIVTVVDDDIYTELEQKIDGQIYLGNHYKFT